MEDMSGGRWTMTLGLNRGGIELSRMGALLNSGRSGRAQFSNQSLTELNGRPLDDQPAQRACGEAQDDREACVISEARFSPAEREERLLDRK